MEGGIEIGQRIKAGVIAEGAFEQLFGGIDEAFDDDLRICWDFQVDGAVGSMQALPGVVEAVGDRTAVLLDSGIRGGSDVFKALHAGAQAVLLGRAWAYGLAVNGWQGVRDVIRNVVAEIDLTMGLTGCASLADVREATVLPA